MRQAVLTGVVLSLAAWLRADPVAVPNASFEQGDAAPAAWTMVGAGMAWERGQAADGERYVTLTGSGDDSTYWQSPTVPLLPGGLYRVSFMARAITAAGGTAVTGPVFCNRDIGCPSPDWTRYTAAFVCRDDLTPEQSWLRFGQWHVGGTLAFDAISLVTVQAVHARGGDLELGDGEAITGNAYEFNAPLGGLGLNHSRPLAVARCGFNTNRWVFGADSEVVYRHQLGARQQTQARVEITVGWYSGGQLQAEVSRDGQTWQPAGVLEATGTLAFAVPAALLPANVVQVRLKAMAKAKVGVGDSDPGSFQVHGYRYQADVDGAPLTQRGQTAYLETTGPAKGLRVEVLSVGDGVPGGSNAVRLRVTRDAGPVVTAQPVVTLRQEGGGKETRSAGTPTALAEGQTAVTCPYELPGSGSWEMTVSLGDAVAWTARAEVYVPEFYEVNYGEILPGSTEAVALWWAASGWKVPRTRPVPATRGEALLIRAAGNEAEAAQVVLRPATALRGLTVTAGALQGPGQARLPAACLEVLNVRYVPVTQKTDATGVNADWPDPLPPLTQPLDLEAGLNQPLWVRVKVPAGTPAGIYRGVLSLQATGYAAEVPVQLEVYGFDLPKRMTCETAFGFDPGSAWDYQKVTDPAQRRQVLDLYWRNFSEHHIAPYNPAPLDPFTVTWPQNGTWEGGVRDPEVKAAGAASLRLRDTSTQGTVSARYAVPVRIPPPGLRLRFKYRTEAPGHVFVVTLNHLDAGGQWMSGRNNDMTVEGDGSWQSWDRTVTAFPPGAESVTLTLWATRWSEEGEATGGVWIDDLSVADVATGAELAKGGDFEPMPAVALVPEFGWAAWDRAVARGLDEFGFNTFSMPIMGLGSGTFHSRVDPELLGYGEATPEYQAAMRDYLGGIEAHLRAKGWLEEAFVYWFDEPDPKDYEFVTNGFRKLKEGAPGLRRMLTEQVEDALVGGPNLWCPISPDFNLEKATVRRREGEQFWWYVCTGPKAPYATLFIDHPGTEMRVWLWQTWERSIEGILVWQSNYWSSSCAYPEPGKPQNPYLDPMGWVSGYSTPRGTKQAWGNGDGRFIYPPEAAADGQPSAPVLAGPVDSIRWEMLRDGIEDYEYFVILRRLLQEKGAGLGADARRRVEELLTVPDSVSVDLTHFTRDPAPLDAHRHLLGQAITELRRRP